MAIATIVNVTYKVFKNSNPAKAGMSVEYGDVLETYDISKGLEESFTSDDPTDDGLMSLKFNNNSIMKLKSHQKIIFEEGPTEPRSNDFKLSFESKCIIQDQNYDAYIDSVMNSEVWVEITESPDESIQEVDNITATSGVRG